MNMHSGEEEGSRDNHHGYYFSRLMAHYYGKAKIFLVLDFHL